MSFKRIIEKETKKIVIDNYLDLTILKMLPMKKFSETTNQRKRNPKLKSVNRLFTDIGSIHIIIQIYNKKL